MNHETNFDDEVAPPGRAEELSPANVFPWPPSAGESPVQAFVETWRGAALNPARFFASMPEEDLLGPSLLYSIIIGVTVAGLGLFWRMILPQAVIDPSPVPSAVDAVRSIPPIVMFLISPVLQIIGLFFGAAITQLMLLVLVPSRGPYTRTVRVYCYSSSPLLLTAIPYVGTLVGMVWSLCITIIGLREAHRTTTGRAVAAVLLPALLLFIAGFVLVMVILVAGVATVGI